MMACLVNNCSALHNECIWAASGTAESCVSGASCEKPEHENSVDRCVDAGLCEVVGEFSSSKCLTKSEVCVRGEQG